MRPTRSRPPSSALLAALLTSLLASGASARAQEETEKAEESTPPIAVQSVTVAPEAPGPETLCRLTVTLRNEGERPVSAFGFDVTVAGHPLPVYDNQLFLQALGAGETVELPLYNFWTSETGRPAPADGKMPVEVTLREARWMKIGEEDGVEVWELEDPVEGLPVSAQTVVTLEKK